MSPGDIVKTGEPICEVLIDGKPEVVTYWGSDEYISMYPHHVDEGNEVGPWGTLAEYTDAPGPSRRVSPVTKSDVLAGGQRKYVFRRSAGPHPRVFLNYRRKDSEIYAGRLHESLVREFGEADVFMDQFSIEPGADFSWAIQQAAANCSVMVALMGPNWLTMKEDPPYEQRKLDSEHDYVRREITAALDRRILVVPLLLPGASVPSTPSLPYEMHGLELFQAAEVSARHWVADVSRVIGKVRAELSAVEGTR
jgi:hypothetical protein